LSLINAQSLSKDDLSLVLLGTKFDLVDVLEVSYEEGQSLASTLSACSFTECSTISEISVQGLFAKLGEEPYKKRDQDEIPEEVTLWYLLIRIERRRNIGATSRIYSILEEHNLEKERDQEAGDEGTQNLSGSQG
jgi:hypothetical protein